MLGLPLEKVAGSSPCSSGSFPAAKVINYEAIVNFINGASECSKTVPILSESTDKITHRLVQFLKDYASLIENELEAAFNKIIIAEETGCVDGLSAEIAILLFRLHELQQIEKKYPILLTYFPHDIAKLWLSETEPLGKIPEFAEALQDKLWQLEINNKLAQLSALASVTTVFKKLDHLLSEHSFRKLQQCCYEMLSRMLISIKHEAFAAIERFDIAEIYIILQRLDYKGSYAELSDKIKLRLNFVVNEQLEKLKISVILISAKDGIEPYRALLAEVKKIEKVAELKEYAPKAFYESWQQSLLDIDELLKTHIAENIKQIRALIACKYFDQAEENIIFLERLAKLLKLSSYRFDIMDQIIEIRAFIKDDFAALMTKFQEMELLDYASHSPQLICKNLTSAALLNEQYTSMLEQFKKIIKERSLAFLFSWERCDSRALLIKNQIIFNIILKSLPDDLQAVLEMTRLDLLDIMQRRLDSKAAQIEANTEISKTVVFYGSHSATITKTEEEHSC